MPAARDPASLTPSSRVELLFVLLFAYFRNIRSKQLQKAAELVGRPIASK